MNKFRFYIGLALISIFALTSCQEKLDLLPYDEAEPEVALSTLDDYESLLKGAYASLLGGGYYGGEFLIRPDIISDNLIINQQGRKSNQTYYLLRYTSDGTWSSVITSGEYGVLNANTILENVANLAEGTDRDNIQGEALALRALVHFDIARVFSKVPAGGGAAGDLGMPYKTGTNITEFSSRLTLGETYANIIADLEAAKGLIGDNNGAGRLNKAAVYALLSRVYLYNGDYANARDNAQWVMDNSGLSVTPSGSFEDLWDNVYDGSTVFSLKVDNADGISLGVVYSQTGPTGTKDEYVPDFGLYNSYASNDVRKGAYFETSAFEGNTYNHVKKYLQRPGAPANVADAPVLRMDEVALNLAEAHARSGNDGAALAALDMLRAQRYSGFVSPGESGNALLNAIKFERRLELAFEGHRMFDIKRYGEGFTRSNNGEFFDGTGTPPPADATGLPAGDNRFQLPISQYEMNINGNMVQNPGY